MTITIILLYLLSFAIIWQFVGYPSLMAIAALNQNQKTKIIPFNLLFRLSCQRITKRKSLRKE